MITITNPWLFRLEQLVIVLLFSYIVMNCLIPLHHYADTDILWHIKQGQIIVTEGRIPETDVFTHPEIPNHTREANILASSWLADVFFYLIYTLTGWAGLVIFKALLITSIMAALFYWLRRQGLFVAVIVVWMLSEFFMPAEIRPTLWSYFFTVWLIFFWERYRSRANPHDRLWMWLILWIWSNTHGMYLVGIGVLCVYWLTDIAEYLLYQRKVQTTNILWQRTITVIGAWLATLFSPVGVQLYLPIFNFYFHAGQRDLSTRLVAEEQPLLAFLLTVDSERYFLGIIFMALILIGVSINSIRKYMKLSETAAILALLVLSWITSRALGVFVLVGVILLAIKSPQWAVLKLSSLPRMIVLGMVMSILSISIYQQFPKEPIYLLRENEQYPISLADFIEKHPIEGRMLNGDSIGNYLLFRLHPRYQVFTDTRHINMDAFVATYRLFGAHTQLRNDDEINTVDYIEAVQPALAILEQQPVNYENEYWSKLLQHYRINFIVSNVTYADNGIIQPLFLKLIQDSNWHLVYANGRQIILAKEGPSNPASPSLKKLPKELLYQQILLENQHKKTVFSYEAMAFAWLMLGQPNQAKIFAQQALTQGPGIIAQACLQHLGETR